MKGGLIGKYYTLKYIAGVIIVTLVISSCSMMSSMQTGRTMKKGDVGLAVGYGSLLESNGSNVFSDFHFLELNLRYGLFKYFDVGLEFASAYPTTLDVKYQFAGTDSSIYACSIGFGFTVQSDDWDYRDNEPSIRTITEIKELFDVSPVTFPAYPDTAVALRSLDKIKKDGSTAAEATATRAKDENVNLEIDLLTAERTQGGLKR